MREPEGGCRERGEGLGWPWPLRNLHCLPHARQGIVPACRGGGCLRVSPSLPILRSAVFSLADLT
ncbi:unnamed protein product [Gulo gulo]|uniref:Uncharacterized protein n=1 Tax=Gulo gulo TaxID=48420 RepID=A0A9X9Q3Y8_GULGU|nr:unnamed protein product [Gulo gulo]